MRGREPVVHCLNKYRPGFNLPVRLQLASSIVIPVLRLSFNEGTHNPNPGIAALRGATDVVEVVVNGFVPFLACRIVFDGTVVSVRVQNLDYFLLQIVLYITRICHRVGSVGPANTQAQWSKSNR